MSYILYLSSLNILSTSYILAPATNFTPEMGFIGRLPLGSTTVVKPSLTASFILRSTFPTGRSSPERPISPKAISLSSIALSYYGGLRFGGNGTDCNKTYGHLNFCTNEETNVIENLIPIGLKNRTQIQQEVKLIVCHDTGNMSKTATAKANSDYVKSGYSGSSTGWHYTVGNDGVYQTVPDNEVAYQANGSANQYTTFIKTNIKATWKKPNFTVSDDYYLMINGQKTNIALLAQKNREATLQGYPP